MRHRTSSAIIRRPAAGVLPAILCAVWTSAPALGQPAGETTVLRAARILDGRGEVLEDRDLVVRDGRIAEIVPRATGRGDRVYDLTALTVLPGYIDTHVHIGNHFDDDGRVHRAENDPSVAHMTLHGAENAYRTLMNGITTMQSLGSPRDAELRAWIAAGYEADVIALDGDPLADPAALGRVVFVMRAGRVYKNEPPRAAGR